MVPWSRYLPRALHGRRDDGADRQAALLHCRSADAAAQYEEARALSIAPLGLGGDTGRRLAATAAVEPLTDTPERPRIDLSATIGQGDGFARVLERAGVARDEAGKVASLVSDAVPLDDLTAGTRMDLVLGRRAVRPIRARSRRSVSAPLRSQARGRADRRPAAPQAHPIKVDDTPLRIQGRVGSSLYQSARAAGVPVGAIETFIKAVSQKLSMRSIDSDARFDAIVEHRRAETGEVQVGSLLFAGVSEGRKKTQMVKWTTTARISGTKPRASARRRA